jgi:phosphoglycolate phosphatase
VTAARRYDLVIFDFDGTLADSGNWFLSIIDDLARRFRFRSVNENEIEALRNKSTREVIAHLGISRWKLPFIATHVRRRFAHSTDQIEMFDGIRAMLNTLSDAGVRMMLCSSNAEANVRAVLGEKDAARFEGYYCGSGLFGKVRKFRRVIADTGLRPAAILSIGDETRDIDAAREVGLTAGAVLWGYANPDALRAMNPDVTFATPEDILAYLV